MTGSRVLDSERSIQPEEAIRALYIDFEGFQDQSPALIGVLRRYQFRQVVLDPDLAHPADERDLEVEPLAVAVDKLVRRCEEEDRCLVAFSQHEKRRILEYAGIDVSTWYRDARLIAKRWLNRRYPNHGIQYKLKEFLRFVEFERKEYLGDDVAATWLRDVRAALRRHGSYSRLTATQKAKWTKLLEHNRIDCCGMRDLVLWASIGLVSENI